MNIRDIASAAHVSVATVSKVINHKDSEISNETRQRVLSVIKSTNTLLMQIYRHLFRLFTNRPSHLLQKKILLFLNMYLTLKKMFPRQVIPWSSVPLMRLLPTASANT